MKNFFTKIMIISCLILKCSTATKAQQLIPRGDLYVNESITTFVVSGENIKMMDISTKDTVVVGNQPGDNIVRIKAVKPRIDGEKLGVVTIVGERNIVQYNLVYTADKDNATTEYRIRQDEIYNYLNPAVDMDLKTMYKYCWMIWDSRKKYYDVSGYNAKMKIRLNNLYTVGNYFFFDVTVENRSKIQFDIEEIRIKLCDKKQSKSTSSQEIELKPVLEMKPIRRFKKTYRNIFVLEKLTFPDEKVLSFTMSEKPISGRTVTLRIDYADVLNADGFDNSLKAY
uniref:conjugative transposon protein TraN n=1 Tax=Bacteroides fragilis TaxID=817 RepID=UPI003567F3BF